MRGAVNYQVLGQAIGAYRRRIDPTVDDDGAAAAILAALEYAHPTGAGRPGSDVQRMRAPRRGAPWSRCYMLVGGTGDVIDVHPARAGAPFDYPALEGTRRDLPDRVSLLSLASALRLRRDSLDSNVVPRAWDAIDNAVFDAETAAGMADRPPPHGSAEWIEMWRAAARACNIAERHAGMSVAGLVASILRTGRK